MCKTTLVPRQLLHSGEKLSWQGQLPGVVQWVTHLSKLPRGKDKFMRKSYRRQTMLRGKVDPGVSELPQGNELSQGMWTGPKRLFPASRRKFLED